MQLGLWFGILAIAATPVSSHDTSMATPTYIPLTCANLFFCSPLAGER